MKIAINTCFGGFGISTKAILYLYEKNSELIEEHTDWKFSDYEYKSEKYIGNKMYSCSSWEIHNEDKSLVYTIKARDEEYRSHPDLIEVVEKLGKESFGDYANLSIVEIPDDIDWQIDEYDGNETIEEKHRSWR